MKRRRLIAFGPKGGSWTTRTLVPRDVDLGERRIRYYEAGLGAPLLMIHGLAASAGWWFHLIPELTSAHFRVLAPDMPGFGRSPGPALSVDESARLLIRLMDRLGLPAFFVCGHSMGGAIAARLAAVFSRRVRRLILVDSAGVPGPFLRRGFVRLVQPWNWCPLHFYPRLIGDALRAGPRSLWTGMRELRRRDIRADLRNVNVPTLVIWGEKDTLTPIEHGRQIAQVLDARLRITPDARHLPMVSDPGRVARWMVDFLSGDAGSQAGAS